jgi:Tol biopolymer transport system component
VLKSAIDLDTLPAGTPRAVRDLIARCLERNPRLRLRDIGEARIVLERPREEVAAPPAAASRRGAAAALPWLGLAAALGVAGTFAGRVTAPEPPARSAARFQVPAPKDRPYDAFAGPATPSPDGRRFLFRIDQGPIAVRRLDTLDTTILPGTERGYDPIFSPDGRQIAFFARSGLSRIDAAGLAPPQLLAPAEDGRGAAWGGGDVILYAPRSGSGLLRVDARGGEPVEVTRLDVERKETSHVRPSFLPDGRHFVYLVKSELPDQAGIYVGSLDDSSKQRVLPITVAARYVPPGYLLYLQDQSLVARPFDPRALEVRGDPQVLARGIDYDAEFDVAPIGTSDHGLLLYHSAPEVGERRLAWFDRAGALVATVGEADDTNLDLDPGGTRLAMQRLDQAARQPDIWVRDLARGTGFRLTHEAPAIGPVWSPDGTRIAYVALHGTERRVAVRPAAGGDETVLTADRFLQEPIDWSPDGSWLLLEVFAPGEESNLALLPAAGGTPVPYARSRFNEHSGRFSPDGRWIAYTSDESGREEIYVQPVPPTGAQWLVSTAGGSAPRWRADGREIFYVQPADRGAPSALMSVRFDPGARAGGQPGLGRPEKLFDSMSVDYEPARDGQRFVVSNALGDDELERPIEAIVDFPALLESGAEAGGNR